MKNRFLSILLATIMLASIFALTSCDAIFDSLFGNDETHEHNWSEWETIKFPNCQNPGTAERFCDCGETQTKSLPVSDHNESGWIVDKEATCQEEGNRHKECTVCHTVLVSEKIGKAEHNYGEWIDEIHATTESEGTLGHYHCSVCEKNFDADKKELNSIVIPKLDNEDPTVHNHTSSGWIVDKEATCSADGSRHKECTECKEEIVREIIPATGNHSYGEWYVVKEATEYEDGLRERKCECGKVEQEIIEAPEKEYAIYYMNLKSAEYPSETGYNSKDGLLYLPTVESEGYVFIGWYTASVGGDIVDYIPKGSKQDYVLFAHWELVTYDIKFKNVPNNTNPTYYNIENTLTLVTPKWDGLVFSYWSDETGKVYEPNGNITLFPEGMTGDLILTANWKVHRNLVEYASNPALNVGYSSDDSYLFFWYRLGTIQHVVLDSKNDISNSLYYKAEGFQIDYTLSQNVIIGKETAESISNTISTSVSKSTTISDSQNWAVNESKNWSSEIGGSFAFDYEVECGFGDNHITAGMSMEINGKTGKGGTAGTNSGWETSNSTTNSSTTESSKSVSSSLTFMEQISTTKEETIYVGAEQPSGYYAFVHAGNIEVYAVVIYDTNTGALYMNTYSYLDNMHSMVMYYPDAESMNNPSVDTLDFTIPKEEIINKIENSYYVKYDANGGTGTMHTTMHHVDDKVELPVNQFKKEGYLFVGWELITEEGVSILSDGQSVANLADPLKTVTLKALWAKDPDYDKDVVYTLTTKTGTISNSPNLTYSAVIEYRNRTADSIEIRVKWTTTIRNGSYTVYGQNFKFSIGSVETGKVKVASFNTWKNASSSTRSSSGTSEWVKISLNTNSATTLDMKIYYWQTNSNNLDMYKYDGTSCVNTTWKLNIPAN